ncbi:MAG TPA: hypothetical protein VHT03_14180 [Rhizomicrobium sp.]|jgi:hypothetical protein|nr:hypothetical protein [Rhizomicrobium sp.]
MRSSLVFGPLLVAVLITAAPALALQTVMIPQPGDSTANIHDPNNSGQDQFSTGDSDGKAGDLGAFHFHVTSGSDWPGDPYRFNRPQSSTPDAYGSAGTPGSEFSNSYLFPH